jgi:hypothetical protein
MVSRQQLAAEATGSIAGSKKPALALIFVCIALARAQDRGTGASGFR